MAWTFDTRTALFLGAALTMLIGVLLFIVRRSVASSLQPSLRWWITGTLIYPLGITLIGLRGVIHLSGTAVLSDSLLAAAFAAFAIALRTFSGSRQRRLLMFTLVAMTAALGLFFKHAHSGPGLRSGVVSLLFAVLLASSARAIYRRGQTLNAVSHLTGGLFVFCTALMVYRAGINLLGVPAIPYVFFTTPQQLRGIGLSSLGGLLPVVGTMGFLLMCTERSQQDLAQAARMDYLTGIYNRRAIEDLASRAIAAARRHGTAMAMMVIDVDHFKRINDQYGHEGGDAALIETVQRIRECLRLEDLVGRLGGEEFVAVMPGADGQRAMAAAERMRAAFAKRPMQLGKNSLAITISIGVAVLNSEDAQFSQLLRRADQAMYAAKAAGRNRVMLDDQAVAVPTF